MQEWQQPKHLQTEAEMILQSPNKSKRFVNRQIRRKWRPNTFAIVVYSPIQHRDERVRIQTRLVYRKQVPQAPAAN